MFKYVNGQYVEILQSELEELKILGKQQAESDQNRSPSIEEEVASLKKDNETLTQCILEMSTTLYQ